MRRSGPLAANAALALLVVVACLLVAEIALRAAYAARHRRARTAPQAIDQRGSNDAYDDPADYYGKYDTNPAMDYSTYLGYVSRAPFAGAGYRTNVHHARYDEDFSPEKPAGERRIFVMGGSTAWGQGVRQDQVFTSVAEARLRQPQRLTRVVSMGVTAYGSVQERVMVENLVLGLQPDLVVLLSGWNDSYFGYSGKDILEEQDFMKYRQVLARHLPFVKPPPGKSKTYPPEFDDYASKLHYFLAVRFFALSHRSPADLVAAVQRQALPPERVLATLERNLEILAGIASRRSFRLVLYLQPSIYATRKPLSAREREIVEAAKTGYVGYAEYNDAVYRLYRERLPDHAARHCYAFVDADAAIQAEPKSVFVDHVHFGSRGNRLLGEHLAGVSLRELSEPARGCPAAAPARAR